VTGSRRPDLELVRTLLGRALRSPTGYLVALIGIAATAGYVTYVKPLYRSETVMVYRERPGSQLLWGADGDPSRRVALQLQEMFFARERLQQLIEEFKLYRSLVAKRGYMAGVEKMREQDLQLEVHSGYTYRISFQALEPAVAQLVTARSAELLVAALGRLRREEAEKAVAFLDTEESRALDALRSRETELVHFLVAHPEVAATLRAGPVTADGPLRAAQARGEGGAEDPASLGLEMQAAELRDRLGDLEKSEAAARREGRAIPSADPAREAADTELATAQRALVAAQAQFTESHPDVKSAAAAVAVARERARRAAEPVARAMPGQDTGTSPVAESPALASGRRQLSLVHNQIRILRSRGRHAPSLPRTNPQQLATLGTQYADLDREVREARGRQEMLESKRFQASLHATLELHDKESELVVVDPAFLPVQPARSGRIKMAALGVALSLLLAAGLSVARAAVDDRLHTGVDLARLGLPLLLVEVPRHRGRPGKRAGHG
jgi:hypothetical protein